MKKRLFMVVITMILMLTVKSTVFAMDDSNKTGSTFKISGVTYKVLTKDTVSLVDGTAVSGDYTIPSKVTNSGTTYKVVSIGGKAFCANTSLTSVVIPDSIVRIEDWLVDDEGYLGSFEKCTSLSKITFSKNLTYIGSGAFSYCTALKSVSLPSKLKTIMDEAFCDCRGITSLTLPASVTYVGQCAFSDTSLSTFTIPATCTMFHALALDYIDTLKYISVEKNHPSYRSVDGVVYSKDMTYIEIYPKNRPNTEFKIPEGVRTICSGVFASANNLTKIQFPTTCDEDSLGSAAFQRTKIQSFSVASGSKHLTTIDGVLFTADKKTMLCYPTGNKRKIYFVPNGTEHMGASGTYLFDMCPYIEEIYIPDSVKTFPSIMWYSTNLKKVIFAKNSKISALDPAVFQECSALTSICLPASIATFSDDYYGNEFYYCSSLKSLYVAKNAPLYRCSYFGSQTLSGCPATIYGEGNSNALSRLVEEYSEVNSYVDVSSYSDKVLGLTFDDTCVSVKEGKTVKCSAVIYPNSAANKDVTYTTSNASVATVSTNGTVTGITSGTCYITAIANDGSGEYARCQVTVEHSNKTTITKATKNTNGKKVMACSVCGKVISSSIIYRPKTVTLSKTSYTYSGSVKKPSVTVIDTKGKKISSSNYTVTYSNNKAVGKATVKIVFKGNYSCTYTKTFNILPKTTSVSKLTAKSKAIIVKWRKQTIQTSGYQIQYSTSSKFTSKKTKTVTISGKTKTSKTIKSLTGRKKYYIKVRTYKTVKVNGKSTKIYSSWSAIKSTTTKK